MYACVGDTLQDFVPVTVWLLWSVDVAVALPVRVVVSERLGVDDILELTESEGVMVPVAGAV